MNDQDANNPQAGGTALGGLGTHNILHTQQQEDRDELRERLSSLLNWPLSLLAEWRLLTASSDPFCDFSAADVHNEKVCILLETIEDWQRDHQRPSQTTRVTMRKPIPVDEALSMTRPETQVGRAVRLFAARPNQWIPMPEIDHVCKSLNAHSLMATLRQRFGWRIDNHTDDETRDGRKIKKSCYRFVHLSEAPAEDSDTDRYQDSEV